MVAAELPRTLKAFEFSLRVILFVCALIFAARFTRIATDGFTVNSIYSGYPHNPKWEVNNPPLPQVFDQKFSYLGSGGQCFAFVSEDGAYVLKFFRYHFRQLRPWQRVLPLPSIKLRQLKLLRKLNRDFDSCKLAMEELPEETGLLYVHLNKTDSLEQTARIVDKLGIEHKIELDKVYFLLQKRAEMTYPHLLHLIETKDITAAKEAIDSICSLIVRRCQKGIDDEDADIYRNCGFIDNKAIIIDVGRLKKRETSADLITSTETLKHYLSEISPELADYLEEVRRCSK